MSIGTTGRIFRWATLMSALLLVGGVQANQDKTNIVLFMTDDFGYECLSCYGSLDYDTPNLDRLAENGIRFDHCYSNPLCTPSRVKIMTGRYNHRNYEGFGYLNPNEITFGNLLKEAGYRTAIVGKWQLSGDAQTVENFGFENHCLWNMHAYKVDKTGRKLADPETWRNRYWAPTLFIDGEWKLHSEEEYGPDICRDYALDFIDRHQDQPFLLYYPMLLTHDPFVPTPDSEGKGDRKENFTDMVEYTDKVVGQVIDHLEELGLREETLILFTGDNGTHRSLSTQTDHGIIEGGKSQMTDTGTRVPFIVNWPGTTPAECRSLRERSTNASIISRSASKWYWKPYVRIPTRNA